MRWPNVVKHRIQEAWRNFVGYPVVTLFPKKEKGRALLIYLSSPLIWKENDTRLLWHQNYQQSRSLANLLVQRGYRVDVAHYNDAQFKHKYSYDLVIAHPGIVSRNIVKGTIGTNICLRTGRHHSFVNRAAINRYNQLKQRRGWAPIWNEINETDSDYKNYNSIACFDGDGSTAETYSHLGVPVYKFRNYANSRIKFINKEFSVAKNGFLYMASHLHILKGLDWLLESFAMHSNRQLFVCGSVPRDIRRKFGKEFASKNIHVKGFVDLSSDEFQDLCRCAAWYISATATEGCQGAALNMMAAGLVPILSDACGIDPRHSGIRMNPCTIEVLEKVLNEAENMDSVELATRSRQASEIVQSKFQLRHFLEDWNRILNEVKA